MSRTNNFCGFECIFSKKYDALEFFRSFNFLPELYHFHVVDAALFFERKRVEILKEFTANYFQELFDSHLVGESLVLHLYPNNTPFSEIDSYEDYLESPCEIILLLYDFYYLEVYCKNQEWLQYLFCTAKNIPNTRIERKSEDTDPRTTMYV